jgi:hypothetical protein
MIFNLAPWYYRDFLQDQSNSIFDKISVCEVKLIDGNTNWEAVTKLNDKKLPNWFVPSSIYSANDGSGTSKFKNIAIHKAISEGLERWAFYFSIDEFPREFCFNVDPSTAGMAAFPERFSRNSRGNAYIEATERWCIQEFWNSKLPVIEHHSVIKNMKHFEILSEVSNVRVSLLHYFNGDKNIFGFAGGNTLEKSYRHALVELSRNNFVFNNLKANTNFNQLTEIYDKRIYFFSTEQGVKIFNEKIMSAPKSILITPKLICDKEIPGPWSKYAKVWRCLFENSIFDNLTDHTFFMF